MQMVLDNGKMLNGMSASSMTAPQGAGAGQAQGVYQYHDKYGGYIKHATYDNSDPGRAPEGFYSQYKFGSDGQIMGSADGKTFNVIDGLKLDLAKAGSLHKASQKPDPLKWGPGNNPLASITERLWGGNTSDPDNAGNLAAMLADGGMIKDFKTDANGRLYARVNTGNGGKPQIDIPGRAPGSLNPGQTRPSVFEGYIPLDGYELEASDDGNLADGRSAWFGADGLVALNAALGEEHSGMHVAYSRRKGTGTQPLLTPPSADRINLRTGTRSGG